MDIRNFCDAPASRLEPNIDRLLAAFRGGRLNRIPNFEILMDPRIVSLILDWPLEKSCNSFGLSPLDYVELSRRTAQDAIVVNLNVWAGGMGELTSIEQLEAVRPPDVNSFRTTAQRAFEAVSGTNLGVIAHAGGPLFSSYCVTGPTAIESFMLNLYDNPEFVARMMDWHTEWQLAIVEAVRDLPFAALYVADDLCDNTGLLFPPAVIRELWEPRIARLTAFVRQMKVPLWFHCCGNLSPMLPIFDRLGVDAIHPLQPACNDIRAVRRQWGNRFCLVGNLNIEGVLAWGTPDDVRRAARELLEDVGKQGAYVLASSHSIVDAIPPENYFAMIETAIRYG